MLEGEYAFRFEGRPMRDGVAYYLVGVGILAIDAQAKTVKGKQTSSIVPLSGFDAAADSWEYALDGGFDYADHRGTAWIKFEASPPSPKHPTVTGEFAVVGSADDGQLWLISTKTYLGTDKTQTVPEIVRGEALRIAI